MRKLFAVFSLGCGRSLRALRLGVAAGVEHVRVLRNLGAVSVVVDIGANRGQFALAARHCFPTAHIVSFEPLPGPAAMFRRVFAGDSLVALHEAAIGPVVGEATMHVSRLDDSSSLLPITAEQERVFPGTAEAGTSAVQTGPLEQFVASDEIDAPALLKLDVQGYELEALKGCESLLHLFEAVYCECSFIELYAGQALAGEVVAWLRERRFDLAGVYNASYDRNGRAVQADFLFERGGERAAPS